MKKELFTLVKITVSVFKSPCQVVHVSPSFTGTAGQLCVVLVSALSGVTGLGACSERPCIACLLQWADRPHVPCSSSQQTLLLSENTLVPLPCSPELSCGASGSGWCQDKDTAHRDVLVSLTEEGAGSRCCLQSVWGKNDPIPT